MKWFLQSVFSWSQNRVGGIRLFFSDIDVCVHSTNVYLKGVFVHPDNRHLVVSEKAKVRNKVRFYVCEPWAASVQHHGEHPLCMAVWKDADNNQTRGKLLLKIPERLNTTTKQRTADTIQAKWLVLTDSRAQKDHAPTMKTHQQNLDTAHLFGPNPAASSASCG